MSKIDENLFRTVLEYVSANASQKNPVILKTRWGEIAGEEYEEEDILLAVKYLAHKNCIEIGQNLPRSTLSKCQIFSLRTKDIRIFGILSSGVDILDEPFGKASSSRILESLVSVALSAAAKKLTNLF